MCETLAQYVFPALIAAVVSIVTLLLNRIWKRKDDKDDARREVMDKLEELDGKIDGVMSALDGHIAANDERDAVMCRVRIQRFSDEILHGVRHSKEHFDQLLLDISHYDAYCAANPEFPNQVTLSASSNIKSTYQRCLDEKSFL